MQIRELKIRHLTANVFETAELKRKIVFSTSNVEKTIRKSNYFFAIFWLITWGLLIGRLFI